jgi:hypothetical protein
MIAPSVAFGSDALATHRNNTSSLAIVAPRAPPVLQLARKLQDLWGWKKRDLQNDCNEINRISRSSFFYRWRILEKTARAQFLGPKAKSTASANLLNFSGCPLMTKRKWLHFYSASLGRAGGPINLSLVRLRERF